MKQQDKDVGFQEMVGKTIKHINSDAINCVKITFTDGETVKVFAECGSSPFDIPFFEIYKEN